MTTYFITGGFGFLGQFIVKALHEHDPQAELRVLGRTQRSTLLGIENLEQVRWIQGDLSNLVTFEPELQGVDVIVHNAALVSFRRSDADAVFQANIIGTRNLAKAALGAGCKNFIFISSISAIGIDPPHISNESMYPDLDYKREHDMYGYSKVISEKELGELADQMRVIILNPSVVVGPGSERIDAIYRMVRYLPVMPILSYQNGFVDVRDVARAVVYALTKGHSGERYIVTAHHADMRTYAKLTFQAMGRNPLILPVKGFGVRLMDVLLWVMDLLKLNPGIRRPSEMVINKVSSWEKIQREMGWEPEYSLEQSVLDSISTN